LPFIIRAVGGKVKVPQPKMQRIGELSAKKRGKNRNILDFFRADASPLLKICKKP
jgi:hypothetical protein